MNRGQGAPRVGACDRLIASLDRSTGCRPEIDARRSQVNFKLTLPSLPIGGIFSAIRLHCGNGRPRSVGRSFGSYSGSADMISGRARRTSVRWRAGPGRSVHRQANSSAGPMTCARQNQTNPAVQDSERTQRSNGSAARTIPQRRPPNEPSRARPNEPGDVAAQRNRRPRKPNDLGLRNPYESSGMLIRTNPRRHCVASVTAAPPRIVALVRLAIRSARGLRSSRRARAASTM